jgi:peptidoglycan/LPS O-acetylase OafA/YrhL
LILRIEQLTFTRFIAAIAIVIFHFGSGSYLFNNEYVSFIFEKANNGVSYFFILSGFIMIIAYENRGNISFREYMKNRLARIYPVYFLAIFLLLGIGLFSNINIPDLLLSIFMVQSWFPEKALTLNYPSWSLSVELFFYITFPILANRIYPKLKLKTAALWIISFWLLSQVIYHLILYGVVTIGDYTTRQMSYYPLLHLNEFLIGNLAGLFFIKKLKNARGNYLPFIVITILLLILVLRFVVAASFDVGLLAVLFVPLIFFISLSNDKVTQVFSRPGFVFLGEISYGIYILQVPVWVIFSDYRMEKYFGLHKELDFTSSFLIRLLILITLSGVSYLYYEKPIRNLIKTLRLKTAATS